MVERGLALILAPSLDWLGFLCEAAAEAAAEAVAVSAFDMEMVNTLLFLFFLAPFS